jgi:two-component system NarL family sensor kinase
MTGVTEGPPATGGSRAGAPDDPVAARARVALIALAGGTLLLVAAGVSGTVAASGRSWPSSLLWGQALVAVVFALIGARVAERQRRNPVGWLLLLIGLSAGATVFADGLGYRSVVIAWFRQWVWWPSYALFPLVLLAFPDGGLPSRRWVPVWWVAVAGAAVPTVLFAVAALWAPTDLFATDATAVQPASTLVYAAGVGAAGVALAAVASVAALVVRWRRAHGPERHQLKWLVAAGTLAVAATVVDGIWGKPGVWLVGAAALPVGIGVAVLRYRLYDIDSIVSRTLVYTALTGIVVLLYLVVAVVLGEVLGRSSGVAPLIATGVVAVVFHPLRERLQQLVNRLLYGHRDEPYAVLSKLGEQVAATLEPDAVLPSVTGTIAQALKLPYVAIELPDGAEGLAGAGAVVATSGASVADQLRVPLVYQGETVGQLVVGARSPGEAFTVTDLRLLEDLARHAAVAVRAFRLTTDLQRSRERLVTAREEERRRLRRDLHDGLGPVLGGMVLQLGAVKTMFQRDPEEAAKIVDRVREEAKSAVANIRALVYQLRPPQLDELGLVGALREHASSLTSAAGGGDGRNELAVTIDAPERLPELPAAVEVAAYRIVAEALTNVARHAHADGCRVRLTVADAVVLEISDGGRGLPEDYRGGVGTTSMRERAAELGGTCTITPAPGGGTLVSAHLPLQRRRP